MDSVTGSVMQVDEQELRVVGQFESVRPISPATRGIPTTIFRLAKLIPN